MDSNGFITMENEIKNLATQMKKLVAQMDEEVPEILINAGEAPQAARAESPNFKAANSNAEIAGPPVNYALSEDRIPNTENRKPVAASSIEEELGRIAAEVAACRKCPLGISRIKTVFGTGNPHSRVVFIGEGPGYEEDRRGEPFVGRAGQLLDKILAAMKLSRKDVYITNMVKCHPMINPSAPEARGNDRPPGPEEISACKPYLDRQLELINPAFIVALGSVAARSLLNSRLGIGALRGKWHEYPPGLLGEGKTIRLIPTYHPAALLRNPDLKRDTWEDMKMLLSEMNKTA